LAIQKRDRDRAKTSIFDQELTPDKWPAGMRFAAGTTPYTTEVWPCLGCGRAGQNRCRQQCKACAAQTRKGSSDALGHNTNFTHDSIVSGKLDIGVIEKSESPQIATFSSAIAVNVTATVSVIESPG
jgi:hypothetical protein